MFRAVHFLQLLKFQSVLFEVHSFNKHVEKGFWQHDLGTSYSNSACFDKDDIWRKKQFLVQCMSMMILLPLHPEFSWSENCVSRGPEGQNSEWTFHLVKSYFVENFKEKWPGIFISLRKLQYSWQKSPTFHEIFTLEVAAADGLSQYCTVQFSEHDAVWREMHTGTMILPHNIPLFLCFSRK